MTTPADYKKRINQLRGLQHDHQVAGFYWMMTAAVVYFIGLGIVWAGFAAGWLVALPAVPMFWQGNRHVAKARKYDWLILEQMNKAFYNILLNSVKDKGGKKNGNA